MQLRSLGLRRKGLQFEAWEVAVWGVQPGVLMEDI